LQNARELTQQKPRQAIKMAKTETNRIPNQTTEKYKKKAAEGANGRQKQQKKKIEV